MQQANKEVVRRFFEAFSRHDIEEMKSLVAEDLVQHNSTSQGRDGLAEEARYWLGAFPDASISIEDLIAEGDTIAVRLQVAATNDGEFFGAPATGRKIDVQEIDIARVENGLIAELWSAPDIYGMLTQLEMLPVSTEQGV